MVMISDANNMTLVHGTELLPYSCTEAQSYMVLQSTSNNTMVLPWEMSQKTRYYLGLHTKYTGMVVDPLFINFSQ